MDTQFINRFKINDSFFGRYERLIKNTVIPYQEKAIKDQIDGAEKSHALKNFKMAAEIIKTGKCSGDFYGMVFQDSDVAKWLEGAAYSLVLFPDEDLLKRCDEVINIIGEAQHKDGYLNTYFTVKKPDKRYTNLQEAHELYCAGHMIEAAVAYYECTGKDKLLKIMCLMADNIYEHFITNKAEGYPGHPEIELALLRLYRTTGNEKYKELSLHFINVRGVDSKFYEKESRLRGWTVWGNNPLDTEYCQCFAPVREQRDAVGHAVRAVYLYTAMADAAKITGDEGLKDACKKLWNSITQKRMYLTGAIGSGYEGEAFTKDYHLPNDTAYAETCASIGLIFFARKMLALEKKSEYADILERALYNTVLAGMELDGTKFFYVNPLECMIGVSGESRTHFHTLAHRPKWFSCACCPPNVARLLPSIAEYAFTLDEKTLFINLFIGGVLDLSNILGVKVVSKTEYPYDGKISYSFLGKGSFTLAIRLPSWSEETVILKNNQTAAFKESDGYAYLELCEKDEVTVLFDMSPKQIYASRNVFDLNGKTAFSRGPLIYCAEGIDNEFDLRSIYVSKPANPVVSKFDPNLLYGICEMTIDGEKLTTENKLYFYGQQKSKPVKIKLIPYYAWANRDKCDMRIWLPEA